MGTVAFAVLAFLVLASALTVVLHPNPVKSALALVLTLFLLAVTFVLLEAHMIAALQVLVYAGAIMVLFLFVIMLLNLQTEDPEAGGPARTGLRVAAWVGGVALAAQLVRLALGRGAVAPAPTSPGFGGAEAVARSLYTDFLFPFELTSLLLLVAVIGAVILAQRRVR